jgi:hypothetical protein
LPYLSLGNTYAIPLCVAGCLYKIFFPPAFSDANSIAAKDKRKWFVAPLMFYKNVPLRLSLFTTVWKDGGGLCKILEKLKTRDGNFETRGDLTRKNRI